MYERSQKKRDAAPGCLRCAFVLKPVIAEFNDFQVNEEMVEVMKDMVVGNTHFSQLSLWRSLERNLRSDERMAKQVVGQLMSHVFGRVQHSVRDTLETHSPTVGESGTEPSPLRMGTIHLECPYHLEEFEIEAMGSAMALNRTSKKMPMRLQMLPNKPATSGHWRKWLAYGLFSKTARAFSSLQDLSLISIGSMSVEDVETLSAILRSEHPEEDLCGCPRGKLDDRNAVLMARAPVYWRLNNRGQPRRDFRPLTFEAVIDSVRTFSDDRVGDFVNAMIPGFGRCQVQRSDLVFVEASSKQSSACGLTSLHIGFEKFDPFDADGFLLFIAAIGPSLKVLALNDARSEIDESAILTSCPNLEELVLYGGEGVDLRLNVSECLTNKLPLPDLTYDWDDIAALWTKLGDSNEPLAKCVRRMRVHLTDLLNAWMFPTHQHYEGILNGLLQMLESNPNVWFSQVSIWTGRLGTLYENPHDSMVTFGELMMTLFNTPRQPCQLTHCSFSSRREGASPLQLDTIDRPELRLYLELS
ncbi:hypothetical protein ON010_g18417 [Phytophthora cinnamomi]|nr:hypothetical protein ON010_g18417 [Phytophthora cinnamomi]